MELDLKGKTALVGGAAVGIGRACARQLVSLGARVVLLAKAEKSLQTVIDAFEAHHPIGHRYIALESLDKTTLAVEVQRFIDESGPIEILMNHSNRPEHLGRIVTLDDEAFAHEYDHYLQISVLLAKLVLPGMKEKQFGRIVNIFPETTRFGVKNKAATTVARWAVMGYAKTLAHEVCQEGITVNNVLYGDTMTKAVQAEIENIAKQGKKTPHDVQKEWEARLPMGRFADPEEVASAAAFLTTPAASYINGIDFCVNGGG